MRVVVNHTTEVTINGIKSKVDFFSLIETALDSVLGVGLNEIRVRLRILDKIDKARRSKLGLILDQPEGDCLMRAIQTTRWVNPEEVFEFTEMISEIVQDNGKETI